MKRALARNMVKPSIPCLMIHGGKRNTVMQSYEQMLSTLVHLLLNAPSPDGSEIHVSERLRLLIGELADYYDGHDGEVLEATLASLNKN